MVFLPAKAQHLSSLQAMEVSDIKIPFNNVHFWLLDGRLKVYRQSYSALFHPFSGLGKTGDIYLFSQGCGYDTCVYWKRGNRWLEVAARKGLIISHPVHPKVVLYSGFFGPEWRLDPKGKLCHGYLGTYHISAALYIERVAERNDGVRQQEGRLGRSDGNTDSTNISYIDLTNE